jgi:uncharacterized membrane protein YbhN (UPF0104 family)/SAM-dependent methyltransferase
MTSDAEFVDAATPLEPEPLRRPPRRRLKLALRWGFLLAVLVFAVIAVRDQYAEVREGVRQLSAGSLVAALLVIEASLWLSMLSWRRLLADLGSPLPLGAAARIFFVGQLGKYLPGSLWPVLAQMELARDHHVPRTRTATAALVAIGLGLVGTLLVAGVLLPFAVRDTGWRLALLAGLAVSLVVASPPVLNRLLALGLRLLRRPPLESPFSGRGLGVALGYAAAGWVLQGVGVYALALSLTGPTGRLLALCVGGYAVASAAGIVVLIAPAGLGVREPALVAALAGVVPTGGALVVALVVRLLVTIADLGTGALLAIIPRPGRAAPPGGTPPSTVAAMLPGDPNGGAGAAPPSAAAPGGRALELAKRAAEHALLARVGAQRFLERRRPRPRPAPQPPTDVLGSTAQWRSAVAEARRLRLPLHRDRPKNWDALGAVSVLLSTVGLDEAVLDAGSARYSPVLPWLRLYGYERLSGINLEFGAPVHRQGVEFRHGDVTATGLPAASLGAVTCLSVIEHGVPVEAFLTESARVLRPGGVLVLSTDYDSNPPDTSGKTAYGTDVHIFSPEQVRSLVEAAARAGLQLSGELRLDHAQRPVHWRRQGLDYTFIRLTFTRS